MILSDFLLGEERKMSIFFNNSDYREISRLVWKLGKKIGSLAKESYLGIFMKPLGQFSQAAPKPVSPLSYKSRRDQNHNIVLPRHKQGLSLGLRNAELFFSSEKWYLTPN